MSVAPELPGDRFCWPLAVPTALLNGGLWLSILQMVPAHLPLSVSLAWSALSVLTSLVAFALFFASRRTCPPRSGRQLNGLNLAGQPPVHHSALRLVINR
jgi:hypothetical protein